MARRRGAPGPAAAHHVVLKLLTMGEYDIGVRNWPVLSRLLDEALELPPAARAAWLDQLPSDYADVKPLLQRMLARASDVLTGGFLEGHTAAEQPEDGELTQPAHACGDIVGPWRLVRLLGEGGMASVWLAESVDGKPGPPAALKLPHAGMRLHATAERMAREREILDALDHPNIARLLDAGMSAGGQPYLALEYVEGSHMDEYCRDRRLGLKARLDLFLQCAQAVAHAHASLIVHRDLKPSNILVTGDGQVRLLDFGIAKLLEDGESRETRLTRVMGRALTLDYASPEQIAGRPVTVASDVYSLGVVLYELLANARPYQLKRDSRGALEDAILEVEPRPPSAMAADRTLARALRGDLDTIVLKALKKDPAERYSSVEKFAEDIRLHLENRPVRAQPDRASYRFSKFIRRNRLTVGVTAAVLVTLVACLALALWQAQVAVTERQRAEYVKSFLLSVLLDAHSYRAGRPLSALDLLHRAQTRIDRLHGADAATRVELLNILGASLLSLQDTADAEIVIASAMREAAGLERGHSQALRARMLRNWVRIFRGQYAQVRNEIDGLLREMGRSGNVLPEDLAAAWRARSEAALEMAEPEEAKASAAEALRVAEDRLGPSHNQSVLALVNLCLAYGAAGDPALALDTGERALRRALESYGGQSNHPNVLKARAALAQALATAGRSDEAIQEASSVVRDGSDLFGLEARGVGLDLRTLAQLQFDAGQLEAADRSAGQAIAILSKHFDRDSPGYEAVTQLRADIRRAARRGTSERAESAIL